MKKASFYTVENGQIVCTLCPHYCRLPEGKTGICKVRRNIHHQLIAESYGQICSTNFDPVEKKPLYHFHPGKFIFSVGSLGCNLHCTFCQNWEISQSGIEEYRSLRTFSPAELLDKALLRPDNIGIAYTYNEPTVWYEFMLGTARLFKSKGLKNVMVTNGFINPEPLRELIPLIDAFSVDLKSFSDEFFKKYTFSRLGPVLKSLKTIGASGKHLEITNLIITDTNDDEKDFTSMVRWLADELGKSTVLHLSRYYPSYKMTKASPAFEKLKALYDIARHHLDYVYLGNVRNDEGQNTICPNCKKVVIERAGYEIRIIGLNNEGRCANCMHPILEFHSL